MTTITELKEKAQSLSERQEVSEKQVAVAMNERRSVPTTWEEMFYLLACLNLLNSAVKQKPFKKTIPYAAIKLNVSRILEYLIDPENRDLVDDFWIDKEDKCAFIVSNSFQFTFHNIQINDKISAFVESAENVVKPWLGVRLQFIAADLFEFARL